MRSIIPAGSKILIIYFGNTVYWELTLLFVNSVKKTKSENDDKCGLPLTFYLAYLAQHPSFVKMITFVSDRDFFSHETPYSSGFYSFGKVCSSARLSVHWEKSGAKTAPPRSRFGKRCHLGGWNTKIGPGGELSSLPWNGSWGGAVLAPLFFSVYNNPYQVNQSPLAT